MVQSLILGSASSCVDSRVELVVDSSFTPRVSLWIFRFSNAPLWSDNSISQSVSQSICYSVQARNQDFIWEWGGGANEAKVDQTTEMYFLLSDPLV